MTEIIFHRLANWELRDVLDWYAQRDAVVADQFLTAVEDTVERIRAAPQSHPSVWDDVRWARVRQFPYRLIFENLLESDRVMILAVAHTSRKPQYWQERT